VRNGAKARGHTFRFVAVGQEAQQVLDEEVRRVQAAGAAVSRSHLPMGHPDVEILELAEGRPRTSQSEPPPSLSPGPGHGL
jgi:nucleotide-binding universal stress UspA family protein